MRIIPFLLLALATGCAGLTKPVADAPVPAAGAAKPPAASQPAPKAAAARAATPRASPAPAHAPAAVPAAVPAAAARPSNQAVAKADPGTHLDLKGLERRLKATDAIGVFTKLSLKNSVDDLLAKLRACHGGQQPPTLADLRPGYELLIMKVQSLIQDDDPTLAADVTRSREAIWSVLADKDAFTSI